tara:strand:- start:786 stop:989 length:204 start_codon:yes stop_codon:yes gene_type:complete
MVLKLGDLVRVEPFFSHGPAIGIFIEDDTEDTGEDTGGYPIITRARVLWDGEIYSMPLDQIEPAIDT